VKFADRDSDEHEIPFLCNPNERSVQIPWVAILESVVTF
jgi:hypothetical protein